MDPFRPTRWSVLLTGTTTNSPPPPYHNRCDGFVWKFSFDLGSLTAPVENSTSPTGTKPASPPQASQVCTKRASRVPTQSQTSFRNSPSRAQVASPSPPLPTQPAHSLKMVKFTPFAVASLALLASTSMVSAHEGHEESGSGSHHDDDVVATAGECNTTVSASVIAVVENVTYFDTCASGKTFTFTSIFDANKLSASDFFAFCNSSACLAPMHTVMHSAPLTCLITYKGNAQNLTGEITELHDKCHEVKDAAKAAAASSASGSSASAGSVSTPAPTTSAATASVNSKVLVGAIAGVVSVASFLF